MTSESKLSTRLNEPIKKNRELEALGFEVSVNLATDALTTFLGWAPPAYAVVNFLSAGGANLVAQQMRGEKNINWGEAWASAGLGIVPGLTPTIGRGIGKVSPKLAARIGRFSGKAGSIQRGVVEGAGLGLGYNVIEKGINEKRLPTLQEATLGTITGGGAGVITPVLGKALQKSIDSATQRVIQSNPMYRTGAGILPPPSGSDYGRPWSRYQAALARLKKEGVIDQYGNFTGKGFVPDPPKTSRRAKAKRINPNSTHRIFAVHSSSKSSRIIDRWLKKFTPKEIKAIGAWQRHHRRPLDQNYWLLKGLPDNELLKAQKYQAGRMKQGGDVIQNLMPAPGKAHSYLHDEILDLAIGPKGAKEGRSIGNLLTDIDIDTYLSIDTFEGRKKYIDKFFEATERADQKLGEILKAIETNRTGADVPIEKLVEINSRLAKGEETLLGILDEVLEDIHKNIRLADRSGTIWNINQKINELFAKQNEVMIQWNKKFEKLQNTERLSKASDRIDDMIERLKLERWYLENK